MAEVIERRADGRRRRKAERPHEIIEAAFAEFSRNGYAMTTLDQIAERAGVDQGHDLRLFREQGAPVHFRGARAHESDARHRTGHVRTPRRLHRGSVAGAVQLHLSAHCRRPAAAPGPQRLIAERRPFPALADRYHEEIHRPSARWTAEEQLSSTARARALTARIRSSSARRYRCRQPVIIAPIALVDMWMMMFDDRYPLHSKPTSTLTSIWCSTDCSRSRRRVSVSEPADAVEDNLAFAFRRRLNRSKNGRARPTKNERRRSCHAAYARQRRARRANTSRPFSRSYGATSATTCTVVGERLDPVLLHLAGGVGDQLVTIVKLNAITGVGQYLENEPSIAQVLLRQRPPSCSLCPART